MSKLFCCCVFVSVSVSWLHQSTRSIFTRNTNKKLESDENFATLHPLSSHSPGTAVITCTKWLKEERSSFDWSWSLKERTAILRDYSDQEGQLPCQRFEGWKRLQGQCPDFSVFTIVVLKLSFRFSRETGSPGCDNQWLGATRTRLWYFWIAADRLWNKTIVSLLFLLKTFFECCLTRFLNWGQVCLLTLVSIEIESYLFQCRRRWSKTCFQKHFAPFSDKLKANGTKRS